MVHVKNQARESKVIKEPLDHISTKFQKQGKIWMLWSPGSLIWRVQYKKLSMTMKLSWIKDLMCVKLPCGECIYMSCIAQIIPRNKKIAEKLYILMLAVMKSALILNKCIKLPHFFFLFASMTYSILRASPCFVFPNTACCIETR